ncbi:hypothetical protein PF003_g20064 [Phytophthora fragariae]|nr:hypothetical protein PF003_g20064 [Phytophthora fragariae]
MSEASQEQGRRRRHKDARQWRQCKTLHRSIAGKTNAPSGPQFDPGRFAQAGAISVRGVSKLQTAAVSVRPPATSSA